MAAAGAVDGDAAEAAAGHYGALGRGTRDGPRGNCGKRAARPWAAASGAALVLLPSLGWLGARPPPLGVRRRVTQPEACYVYSIGANGSVSACTAAGLRPVQTPALCKAAAAQLAFYAAEPFEISSASRLPVGCYIDFQGADALGDVQWNSCSGSPDAADYTLSALRNIVCQNMTALSNDGYDCEYDSIVLHPRSMWFVLLTCGLCIAMLGLVGIFVCTVRGMVEAHRRSGIDI
eukprot:TRINITY_DN37920_c0_g1_i1.p1 TRINITY_DN37920_c0_g1~~TRINITY_DN37920_c0_g1_i1.p1  ORF type:complete len:252 (+),score=35.33 TRINITY_DN37920_c0_g1_i1:56-757(+)